MQKILFTICFLPTILFAQTFPIDSHSGKITYTEDLLIKDASQTELYDRAKSWIVSSSGKTHGILVEDPSNGLLKASNQTNVRAREGNNKVINKLWYTVTFQVEDDRLWYKISDFHVNNGYGTVGSGNRRDQAWKQPLEALLTPKHADEKKGQNKALAEKARKSIEALLAEMKSSLL